MQRAVKYLRCHILRLGSIAYAPHDERIDAIEIAIVQISETRGILLRRLDQQTLVIAHS